MGYSTKIATCCYCGTRAALVLGKDRHELACSSCGAPLHDMKRLRSDARSEDHRKSYPPAHTNPYKRSKKDEYDAQRRKYRKKKRKGLMHHFIEEAFDVIEDIFD